jgi:hypothetical protein
MTWGYTKIGHSSIFDLFQTNRLGVDGNLKMRCATRKAIFQWPAHTRVMMLGLDQANGSAKCESQSHDAADGSGRHSLEVSFLPRRGQMYNFENGELKT